MAFDETAITNSITRRDANFFIVVSFLSFYILFFFFIGKVSGGAAAAKRIFPKSEGEIPYSDFLCCLSVLSLQCGETKEGVFLRICNYAETHPQC